MLERLSSMIPIVAERAIRICATCLGVLLLVATLPAGALAGTVRLVGDYGVSFRAAPGERNDLRIASAAGDPSAVILTDGGAPLTPGRGCTAVAAGVLCAPRFLDLITVNLGDRSDRADLSASRRTAPQVKGGTGDDRLRGPSCLWGEEGADILRITASPARSTCFGSSGGDGADRLIGSPRPDDLFGGSGTDELTGGAGEDFLGGGGGPDRVRGGPDNDNLHGGRGEDLITAAAGRDIVGADPGDDTVMMGPGGDLYVDRGPRKTSRSLSGDDLVVGGAGGDGAVYLCIRCKLTLDGKADDGRPGERDDLRVENLAALSAYFDEELEAPVTYRPGPHVLVGDAGSNRLLGGAGRDIISGMGGSDFLSSGPGDDLLRARDGRRDSVNCGSGSDRALVDPLDLLVKCEASAVG